MSKKINKSSLFLNHSFLSILIPLPLTIHHSLHLKKDSCAFDKYAIDHEATINYDTSSLKTLDQFTLCLWMRFTKHDGDHVLFTYAGELIIIALPCCFTPCFYLLA